MTPPKDIPPTDYMPNAMTVAMVMARFAGDDREGPEIYGDYKPFRPPLVNKEEYVVFNPEDALNEPGVQAALSELGREISGEITLEQSARDIPEETELPEEIEVGMIPASPAFRRTAPGIRAGLGRRRSGREQIQRSRTATKMDTIDESLKMPGERDEDYLPRTEEDSTEEYGAFYPRLGGGGRRVAWEEKPKQKGILYPGSANPGALLIQGERIEPLVPVPLQHLRRQKSFFFSPREEGSPLLHDPQMHVHGLSQMLDFSIPGYPGFEDPLSWQDAQDEQPLERKSSGIGFENEGWVSAKFVKWIKLMFRGEGDKGGIKYSPLAKKGEITTFDNLPPDEFRHLMRILWWSSQYGYVRDLHYRSAEGIEYMPFVQHLSRFKAQNHYRDAQVAVIDPYQFGGIDEAGKVLLRRRYESLWYCLKLYPNSNFCDLAEIVHFTFRGMQLTLDMTTPPVDDLIEMKGRTEVIECNIKFRLACTKSTFEFQMFISRGTCNLLRSLIQKQTMEKENGLKVGLMDYLYNRIKPGFPQLFVFGGLSFGGALAQAAVLLFNMFLERTHNDRDLFATDVHVATSLVTFGSPRAVDKWGRDLFEGFARKAASPQFVGVQRLTGDQFHLLTQYHGRPCYDPVGMWPNRHYPLGRQHTIRYSPESMPPEYSVKEDLHFDNSELFTHLVHSDSSWAGNGCDGRSPKERCVPRAKPSTFTCLHLFPKYKKTLERGVVHFEAQCIREIPATKENRAATP